MKILAFAGSSSRKSINKKLVKFAASQFKDADIDLPDLHDYEMPIYSSDREETDGVPAKALEFAEKIDAADLILLSLAEHNSSYTTAFKNIFDWVSRIQGRKHFGGKDIFLMGTATGPGGGKNVVEAFSKRAPFSGAEIVETFILPRFNDNFIEGQGITDPDRAAEFNEKILRVKQQLVY